MSGLIRIKKSWSLLAAYYGRQLSDEVLAMYAEDLSDLPHQVVLDAMSEYRRNPKNRHMPLPAHIRDLIEPVDTPENKAREIAAKIEGAIVKFGHPNAEAAREYIGAEGWEVIQRYGGWGHICQSHGVTISPASFHAQVRDQLVSIHRRPATERLAIVGSFGDVAKALPWGKE